MIDALGSMSQISLTKQILKKYTFDAAPGHCVLCTMLSEEETKVDTR